MDNVVYGWGFPPDVSVQGPQIDHLIIIVHWFMAALFVGWGIFFVYCLIRFRKRPGHKASYESSHSKIPKILEAAVVLFEVFLLVGLSFPIWSKYKNLPPPADKAVVVRIIAQQFVWNVIYPGRDGKFGRTDPKFVSDSNQVGLDPNDPAGKDDIVTINQLHFPVHKPVIAYITTKDVIHSFSVPVLRVKQDAIPGMSIPIWWEATETGSFEIVCDQLCGVGHTLMRGFVTIDTPEAYDAWMKEQEASLPPPPVAQAAPAAPATPETTALQNPEGHHE